MQPGRHLKEEAKLDKISRVGCISIEGIKPTVRQRARLCYVEAITSSL